jgi:hypothetical protein
MINSRSLVRLTVLLAAACAACVRPAMRMEPPAFRIVGAAAWPALPSSYRMVHRIHLDVRGRSMDFLGYLAVSGDRWRAVAFTELGGRLFDLIHENGRSEVLQSPPGMPRAPVLEGVMSDIAAAFAPAGRPGRAADSPGPDRGPAAEPVTMMLLRGEKTISEITILSSRAVEGWPAPVPERLSIKSRQWGYTMMVMLVRMDLRSVDETAFIRSGAGR